MRHPSRRGLPNVEASRSTTNSRSGAFDRRSCRYVRNECLQGKTLSNVDSASCGHVPRPLQFSGPTTSTGRKHMCKRTQMTKKESNQLNQQCECLEISPGSQHHKTVIASRADSQRPVRATSAPNIFQLFVGARQNPNALPMPQSARKLMRRVMANPPVAQK